MSKKMPLFKRIAESRRRTKLEKQELEAELGSLREQYANLWFAYKFIYHANKKLFLVRIPLLLLQTTQTLIPIFFVREILNELTDGRSVRNVIAYAATMALASFVIKIITSRFSIWDSREREKLGFKVRKILSDAASDMTYATLENPKMQNYVHLARQNRFDNILQLSTAVIGAVFNIIGVGTVVLSLNPLIFVVIMVSSIIKFLIDRYRRKFPTRYNDERVESSRLNAYYMNLMSDIPCGKEIRVNNIESWLDDRVETSWKTQLYPIDKAFHQKLLMLQSINGIVSMLQDLLIYIILATEVLYSTMTVGDFSMYLTAAGTFSSAVMGVSGNYSTLLMQAAWYLREYRRCLSVAEKQKSEEGKASIGLPENVEIEFRNVSFAYPGTQKLILRNVNLTIKRGESLSLVGANGAGKTTFVKLICRFYEPTEGEILVNGVNVKDISYDEYCRLLGVVFQDFKLFSFTARENVTMDIGCDDEKLCDSIKKCGLEERINTLPNGVDTYIYKAFDPDGVELSGGEGQKLAIARAIYRSAPIVIFDESTSALDPIAEYDIYRNFHDLSENRTAIYISHRMSSTRFTDHTAVFADGTVVEYGTHDELMSIDGGVYREMFNLQARYYRE